MATERHHAAFVGGAILGGIAGAAVTLWRVPQSGARTRAQIAERVESVLFRVLDGKPGPQATASSDEAPPLATPLVTPDEVGDTILLPDPLDAAPVESADDPTEPIATEAALAADVVIEGPHPTDADR